MAMRTLPIHLPILPTITQSLPSNHKIKNHRRRIRAAAGANPSAGAAGAGDDELRVVADLRSPHNHIRVVDVSRLAAGHPLAGARLLLLDAPGNIHSLSFPFRPHDPLTSTYLDVFATLPPLLPAASAGGEAPVAVLGFGAGTAARLLLHFYPGAVAVHGYELDACVVSVAREYFGLAELERRHGGRLSVHVGDALAAAAALPGGGFAGVLVDLYAKGSVLPALQEEGTWRGIRRMLRPGGRAMANCGGGCVEAEGGGRDGEAVKEATVAAMAAAFGGGMVSVMNVAGERGDDNWVALTGPPVMAAAWKEKLPAAELRRFVDMWTPWTPRHAAKT